MTDVKKPQAAGKLPGGNENLKQLKFTAKPATWKLPKRLYDWTRLALPYGVWSPADGGEVLCNRLHQPIWERAHAGATAEPCHRDEWIHWVEQDWLYSDANPPFYNRDTFNRCCDLLVSWGIALPPEVRR